MEVVACFLQKYFSLLTAKDVNGTKGLYADNAIVSAKINGEIQTASGSALVEKLAGVFGNGTVTITDVNEVSSPSSIVLTASGSVAANGVESPFNQQTTLFFAAKHWYIVSEQFDITVPEPAQEKVEEVAEPVAQKAPTPQRSPAAKPKEAPKETPKAAAATPAPVPTPAAAAPATTAAPKPAAKPTSWAAAAATTTAAEKPKVNVTVAPTVATPAPTAAPKVTTPITEVPPNGRIHFTLNITPGSVLDKEKDKENKELRNFIQSHIAAEVPKSGLPKETIVSVRANVKDTKVLVFADFNSADALKKLQENPPTILGTRIIAKLQNPKY